MTGTGASLRLVELTKAYGTTTVVDQVSLDVAPGEFVTLLGPSGSGKTTTLNMIAGFTSVSGGEIFMDDRPIARLKPHRRGIGVVFQHYALFPHMSVAANVGFPLRQRHVGKSELKERVDRALDLVGLTGMRDRRPNQLSGGQQQRVALARALVFEPRVLLMDEPLGALDKKLRESLQLEIKRIHREVGISFVYVTHDQEEALGLSDRIAVFDGGRIAQVGTAEQLYERPGSVFVADFLGESNQVSGTYVADSDRGCVQCGALRLRVPGTVATGMATGTDVTAVIRPEHLRVTAGGDLEGIAGQVAEVLYLGGSRRVEVRADDGETLVAREQAGAWKPLSIGDRVTVGYSPERAVLLAGAPTTAPRPTARVSREQVAHGVVS